MKKIFLAASLLTAMFAFVACGGDNEEEQQNNVQNKQIDSLKSVIAEQELAIAERDSLMVMLNEVDSTFAQLESEYVALQKVNHKNPEANTRRLTDRVNSLRDAIKQLNGRISNLDNQNKDLQAYITRLEERSAAQEAQIAELITELENNKMVIKGLNKNVDELTASNQEKDQLISKQISDANRAWFIVGTYDELKEAGIVNKSGGFIGIGRKQGVVANMNTDQFTEIDRTKVTTITINLKKPVLITQHPEGSYEFVADEENKKVTAYLRILNPGQFWHYSPYLVISTK